MEQMVSFSDLGVGDEIVSVLARQGIDVPFEVQKERRYLAALRH